MNRPRDNVKNDIPIMSAAIKDNLSAITIGKLRIYPVNDPTAEIKFLAGIK